MTDVMTPQVVYGAIGVFYQALILVRNRNQPADTYHWPVLNVVVPLLTGAMTIAGWPLWLSLQLWSMPSHLGDRPKNFAVTRKDLIQKNSVDDVDQRECVIDPLEAVPNLRFDFLNPVWLAFKAKLGSAQTVWTFSKQWKYGHNMEERAGYVCRRRGTWGRIC